jgi:FAD/FMN-containing dehydrogenase
VPISAESEWFVLIESTSSSDKDIHAKFEQFMHLIFDKKFVQDGVIAQSEAQRRTFWKFRESIPEANRLVGSIGSTDISLPLGEIAEFIKMVSHEISLISDCQINCFGHVGDGNLHFNLFRNWDKTKSSYDSIAPKLTNLIYDEVVKRNGSISAEHGIGRLNKARLLQSSDKIKIETMKAIKSAIDPNGIFNPGALIDL